MTMLSPPTRSLPMTATPNTSTTDLNASLFLPISSPLDPTTVRSPSRSDSDPLADSDSTGSANASALLDVDPQIVEALKSKDRIYVLKLGEQMESLINDRRSVVFFFPYLYPQTASLAPWDVPLYSAGHVWPFSLHSLITLIPQASH